MWEMEERFKVRLGGNDYFNTPNLVAFKGQPLFKVLRRDSDGMLGIDFDVHDASGKKVAVIRNSKIVDGDSAYEISREASVHSVIDKSSGKTIAMVARKAGQLEVTIDTYLPNGARFLAGPESTNLDGLTMTGNTIMDCGTGLAIN